MTAPEMVSVIAAVLESHLGMERETWNIDPEYFRGQARAVLDALTKAGGVEWGVLAAGQERPYTYDSEDAASDDAKCACCTLVSRITGPWTAVE